MDLVKVILKEHSKKQKDLIVHYVDNQPARFAELITVFLNGPYRVTQRASWPVSYCIEKNPLLIRPHFKTLLKILTQPGIHDAVKRNIIRTLQFVKIPKAYQGKTVNVCLHFLQDGKEPVAIRVFAMTVLANIAKENPALKNEIIPIIEDMMPFGSAGFISRGNKVLKVLKQKPSEE
jgi:hypothetical protein